MSQPRRRRDTDTDEVTDMLKAAAIVCLSCTSPDPQARHIHYAKLIKERGLDTLRQHITEQYVRIREPGKQRQDTVDAIMLWASNLVEQYSGMVHPETGAPMPWWQARQWLMDNRDATAASAYHQAPEKYKAGNPPPGNLAPVVHSATVHIVQQIATHIPQEPGDDDPLAI